MPLRVDISTVDPAGGVDASNGALDPEIVWFQYLCQTPGGGHDPALQPDSRVRPSHAALHGTIWRLDDPSAPVPPVDFGCRCAMRYVAAPNSRAANVLPTSPAQPTTDPAEPGRKWLDANSPGWEAVAKAAADVAPQRAEVAAFRVAESIGMTREVARLVLQVQPYAVADVGAPMGLSALAGVGAAGRALALRWLAGDLEAGALLAEKYPATFARLTAEAGRR